MNTESIYKTLAGEQAIMAFYGEVLARWPVAHETYSLSTRHGETFIIDSGEKTAPPLILLHGAASNALSWIGEVSEYSASFRVLAVDIPGDPGKSAQNRPSWEGSGYAEWLEDVINGLNISKTALLGLSQGGWTAIKFAVVHPERVEKLILLTPGGVMPTRPSFIMKAIFFTMFGRWGAKKLNDIVIGNHAIHPDAVKFMNIIMTNFKSRIDKEYLFTDDELKRLDMPVLLLGGAEDAIRPMDGVAARMQKLTPQTEVELIPGTGHVLINISERVIPFLRK